jgi:hypothetical protein
LSKGAFITGLELEPDDLIPMAESLKGTSIVASKLSKDDSWSVEIPEE